MEESRREVLREGAKRAKAIALEKYKAGDLDAAKQFAARARRLNPSLSGVLRLNAVLDLLIGFEKKINGEPDWYAVLSVEPTADVETIDERYRTLFLSIVTDDDDSVGSIDQANMILVDAWKFLCNEERKKVYDEQRGEQLRLRDMRRADYENQRRVMREGLIYEPVILPAAKPGQRLFNPPRIVYQETEHRVRPTMRVSQFNCPASFSAPTPQRLFDPPTIVGQENADDEVEEMVQERPLRVRERESKRKEPPLTDVIHYINQLTRISLEGGLRFIERKRNKILNLEDVIRCTLADKARSTIQDGLETHVSASQQANDGSDAATRVIIPQDSKRVNRKSKNTNDMVIKEIPLNFSKVTNVPDPDFYDFDKDRTESSFGENEVWAAYDDYDAMPRNYALVHRVVSREPFELCISWLDCKSNKDIGPMKWIDSGFYKTSGRFWMERRSDSDCINSFSHRVQWTKGEKKYVYIYPKKGDVWALYTNWSRSWGLYTPDEVWNKYEMVQVIEDFDEERGVAVAPLVKVPGFKTVFRRLPDSKTFPKKELFRFSHQVPSHLLTGEEGENAPRGCLELDPAAMSSELLKVLTEEEVAATMNQ